MNRMEEYQTMLDELDRPAAGLDTTLERAYRKRKQRITRMVTGPVAGLAACFAAFILLVNFSAPVANACSKIPILRELAEAVTFSPSLSSAVENEYVQPMGLTQTENGITAEIVYLIVDQKQVNVFYRLSSDQYGELRARPEFVCVDEQKGFAVVNNDFGAENRELHCVTVDFVNEDVPDKLQCSLKVYSGDFVEEPAYLAEFEFLLEFDPKFTSTGKIFPVNQTIMLGDQQLTVTDIQVYPSHMRVNVAEAADNTAWLKDLHFYIETDRGVRFDTVSNGISATGSADTPSIVSYRADSSYFYEAEHLKLVITGAKWLRKDMQTTYVNLITGETGELPEGASFESAKRQGSGWIITFRADLKNDEPMYQLFDHQFYDADGNEYEINQWSSMYGTEDEDGNYTYFFDQFPLFNYPYDEVWLSPSYSHYWSAEDVIVINVQ